jgi:hypothetical protein
LISDKVPAGLRNRLDRLGDVSGEVGFGARGSEASSHKLSSRDIQVGDQTLRAMALICKFFSLDVTRLYGQRGMEAFQCLNAGHLICACHMCARRGERRRGLIHLTDREDLLGQFDGVVGRGSEPIPLAMRL